MQPACTISSAAPICSIPDRRSTNVYECADGRFIAIAPIELKFRKVLFERLGLAYTTDDGAAVRDKLEELFKTRTRDEWCSLLEGTDACFAPVLTMAEAPHHPHNVARGTFIEVDGVVQPAPRPALLPDPRRAPDAAARARRRIAIRPRRMGHPAREDRALFSPRRAGSQAQDAMAK